ncbi:hypothetical protein A7982_13228 [Minicystis rosea]|nr:hypothetical protein A7982_13228 [Minicystis rosea]
MFDLREALRFVHALTSSPVVASAYSLALASTGEQDSAPEDMQRWFEERGYATNVDEVAQALDIHRRRDIRYWRGVYEIDAGGGALRQVIVDDDGSVWIGRSRLTSFDYENDGLAWKATREQTTEGNVRFFREGPSPEALVGEGGVAALAFEGTITTGAGAPVPVEVRGRTPRTRFGDVQPAENDTALQTLDRWNGTYHVQLAGSGGTWAPGPDLVLKLAQNKGVVFYIVELAENDYSSATRHPGDNKLTWDDERSGTAGSIELSTMPDGRAVFAGRIYRRGAEAPAEINATGVRVDADGTGGWSSSTIVSFVVSTMSGLASLLATLIIAVVQRKSMEVHKEIDKKLEELKRTGSVSPQRMHDLVEARRGLEEAAGAAERQLKEVSRASTASFAVTESELETYRESIERSKSQRADDLRQAEARERKAESELLERETALKESQAAFERAERRFEEVTKAPEGSSADVIKAKEALDKAKDNFERETREAKEKREELEKRQEERRRDAKEAERKERELKIV